METMEGPVAAGAEADSQGLSQVQTQTQTQSQHEWGSAEGAQGAEVSLQRAWGRLYRQPLSSGGDSSPAPPTRRALGCGPRAPRAPKSTVRLSPPQPQPQTPEAPSPPLPFLELISPQFKFGRARTCDFTIGKEHASEEVLRNISKEHFLLSRDTGGGHCPTILEDLSYNGTFINGQKVGKGNKRILENEDRIAITLPNQTVFVFVDLFTNEQNRVPNEISEKYYISKTLGVGACGVVKLVYNKMTCDKFAMKIVTKKQLVNGQRHPSNDRKKIMNEVKILKALRHPFIVDTEEVIESTEAVYIILELMEGGELFDHISHVGKLPERSAKAIFRQMVLAVKYLHDQGITHRDLKPENVLLGIDKAGNRLVKLTDFGLSKFFNGESFMRTMCGTPLYVAPEVLLAEGKTSYSSQVDVWSLGVVLFICLSGYLPFSHEYKDLSLRDQIISGRFNYSRRHWQGVSRAATSIVTKLLTVDPQKRITIDGILADRWMQDELVIKRVEELIPKIHKNISVLGRGGGAPSSPSMKRQLSESQRLDDPPPKRRKVIGESGDATITSLGISSEDTDEDTSSGILES